jgi:hypothetical protein
MIISSRSTQVIKNLGYGFPVLCFHNYFIRSLCSATETVLHKKFLKGSPQFVACVAHSVAHWLKFVQTENHSHTLHLNYQLLICFYDGVFLPFPPDCDVEELAAPSPPPPGRGVEEPSP